MAATMYSTVHVARKQVVECMAVHLHKHNNVEVELSSNCTVKAWTEHHAKRINAKISVPNYFTLGSTEYSVNPSTLEQLNTLLVLTYGTNLMLAQTSNNSVVEFQYILFATDNLFDKFTESATFIEKVLDNLPGNVVQLTSTKETDTFDFYNNYY